MLSKICFGALVLLHLLHGTLYLIIPLKIVEESAQQALDGYIFSSSNSIGPEMMEFAMRSAAVAELTMTFAVLVIGDTRFGYTALLASHLACVIVFSRELDSIQSSLSPSHAEGFDIGLNVSLFTLIVNFIGLVAAGSRKKLSPSTKANFFVRMILGGTWLLTFSISTVSLLKPEMRIQAVVPSFDLSVFEKVGLGIFRLELSQQAAISIGAGILLHHLKPPQMALFLTCIFHLGQAGAMLICREQLAQKSSTASLKQVLLQGALFDAVIGAIHLIAAITTQVAAPRTKAKSKEE